MSLGHLAARANARGLSARGRRRGDRAWPQPGRQTGTDKCSPLYVTSVQIASGLQSPDTLQRSRHVPLLPPVMSRQAPRPPRASSAQSESELQLSVQMFVIPAAPFVIPKQPCVVVSQLAVVHDSYAPTYVVVEPRPGKQIGAPPEPGVRH
jgi:hypothetical protein